MKLALLFCLVSISALAQKNGDLIKKYIRNGKDSTVDFQYYYKFTKEDSLHLNWNDVFRSAGWDCNCPIYKPGDKFPDAHPNAKYLNDTTLWEWREVDFGGGWKEKVYDLKPQYKDTIIRNDGSPFEVPVWIKYPGWRKPEEKKKVSNL